VLVVIAEAPNAGHPRPRAVVEVERIRGLEGILVEEGPLGGVEALQVLGKDVSGDGGDAADAELAGHVAGSGAEVERRPRRVAEDRAELPAAEDRVERA